MRTCVRVTDDPSQLRCSRCGMSKPATEFAWRRKASNQRDSFCRPCRAIYKREHYSANKRRYIEQARLRKQRARLERTRYLIAYFATHPCVDCGETDPVVLEFDHLRDKEFEVTQALADRRWSRILEEIEKCDVVCANCHRRRTCRRRRSLPRRADRRRGRSGKRATGLEPALRAWKALVQPLHHARAAASLPPPAGTLHAPVS